MNPSNPRNPTGCKVEVRIRLRQPLLKRHIVTKEERWVQIEMNSSLDSNASPPVSEPKPRPPQRDSTAVVPTAQTPVGDNLADTDIEILVLRFKRY